MRAQSCATGTQFERQRPNVGRGPVQLDVAPEVADCGAALPRARQRHVRQRYNTTCRCLAARIRNLAMNFALAGDSELRGSWGELSQRGNVEAVSVDLTAEASTAKFDRSRIQLEVAEHNRRFGHADF